MMHDLCIQVVGGRCIDRRSVEGPCIHVHECTIHVPNVSGAVRMSIYGVCIRAKVPNTCILVLTRGLKSAKSHTVG